MYMLALKDEWRWKKAKMIKSTKSFYFIFFKENHLFFSLFKLSKK